jgi:hypothetical protein
MSTAAVFLDIENPFDTTWHSSLLYKLSKFEFSTCFIKLIGSFLSKGIFRVSAEGEISAPRVMQTGVPQGSVLSPTLFNMYINDAPETYGVYLSLFADDTCRYATDRKEGFVVRKLQRGLSSMETWCYMASDRINYVSNFVVIRPPILKYIYVDIWSGKTDIRVHYHSQKLSFLAQCVIRTLRYPMP